MSNEHPQSVNLTAGLQVQAAADTNSDGKPALPRFSMTAYTGGPMQLAGWRYPVVVDLAGMSIPHQSLPIRMGHDAAAGVGHTDSIQIADGQLLATGVISRGTEVAQEVITSSKNGFPWQASIGANVDEHEFIKQSQAIIVNGKTFNGPVNVVRKSTLGEISFVDLGADNKTSASVAANQENTDMNHEEQQQTTNPPQDQTPDVKAEGSLSARIDAEIFEARRRSALEDMAMAAIHQHQHDVKACERIRDLMVECQNAGDSAKDFEIKLIRATWGPRIGSDRNGIVAETSPAVLSAASMISGGIGEDIAVKEVGEQAVEAAHRRFGRDMGLQEIILAAAQLNGYSGRNRVTVGNWREVWAYAAGKITAAGYSTVNLPNILGNVANKAAAKVANEPRWIAPKIAGKANHSNFHAHTVCSLAASGTLESVGPTGELKSLNLSEETYTRQVGTRGAVLRLSRTDIINDDLGTFTSKAENLVRKGYNAREKALFALINDSGAGASHFTTARGNYVSGETVGTVADMAQMIKAFRLLEGPDGEPINVEPSIVLCGPLYESAFGILLGQYPAMIATGVGNSARRAAATNIYAGKFGGAPLVSPWLEKTAAGGGAANTYSYLFADPNILPCYEIAYLNGVESPTVEYFGLDQDVDSLGVAWRIFWDFGVAAAEWRAGVKSAGS